MITARPSSSRSLEPSPKNALRLVVEVVNWSVPVSYYRLLLWTNEGLISSVPGPSDAASDGTDPSASEPSAISIGSLGMGGLRSSGERDPRTLGAADREVHGPRVVGV